MFRVDDSLISIFLLMRHFKRAVMFTVSANLTGEWKTMVGHKQRKVYVRTEQNSHRLLPEDNDICRRIAYGFHRKDTNTITIHLPKSVDEAKCHHPTPCLGQGQRSRTTDEYLASAGHKTPL